MERRQLEYFVAAVEHGGFTSAAAALHVTQPTLSRAVRLLENELRIELFQRTSSGIIATPAAHSLVRQARRVLLEMDQLRSAGRGPAQDATGIVEVGVTSGMAADPMPLIAAALRASAPGIRTVGVAMASSSSALNAVSSGEIQVALFGSPARPETGPSISVTALHPSEVVVAVPGDSDLRGRTSAKPSALREFPFIVTPKGTILREKFDEIDETAGGLNVIAEVAHREAILPMVGLGLGAGLLPAFWARAAKAFDAVVLPLSPRIQIPIWMVHRLRVDGVAARFIQAAEQVAGLTHPSRPGGGDLPPLATPRR